MNTHTKPVLGVYGLSCSYGGRVVVDEVSFEVDRGDVVSLLGPNGSGKSTLLKAIAGVLPRSSAVSGQVRYKDHDLGALSPALRARQVAYLGPDLRAEFPLTAAEAVSLGRSSQGASLLQRVSESDREAVRAAMERCQCWNLRDRDLHTLSGGERQLVALARALAQGAGLLLLDETLSRMDLNHQAEIGKLLRALAVEGKTILLVSHDVNLASEWADSGLILKSGRRIAIGKIREVLTEENVRALYPGASLMVGSNPSTGSPLVFFK